VAERSSGWHTLTTATFGVNREGVTFLFQPGDRARLLAIDELRSTTNLTKGRNLPAAGVAVIEVPLDRGPAWTQRTDAFYVTAITLRLQVGTSADPCGACDHAESRHYLYLEPGAEEPWSWCDGCGGRCEFVASQGEARA
jgi:hypothetical protein